MLGMWGVIDGTREVAGELADIWGRDLAVICSGILLTN